MSDLLSRYDFSLPKRLIAQRPAEPRDHSRLLVYQRSTKTLTDDYFYNIDKYLHPKTTLVLNNSRVDRARLKFADREVFVTKQIDKKVVEALVFPGKQFHLGDTVELAKSIEVEVLEVLPSGQRRLKFNLTLDNPKLNPFRQTPFPPYIKADESLANNYQTVYSKVDGSKAAPTAGLHFTTELLGRLEQTHKIAEVTLHVGLGTFAPLKASNLESGKLHEEWFEIDNIAAEGLTQASHLTAVGTTSARVLESAVAVTSSQRKFTPQSSKTDIFIRPGFKFQAVDSLITNFHLPKSSLLMLVSAMVGVSEMQRIYAHAIAQQYRFYSFGDATLIL